jgi:peptidyl-dipeptidase Dcp
MNNPLLSVFNTPYHSIPFEEISPEHFRPAFDTAFNRAGQEIQMIKKIEEAPDFNNTIVALENSAKMLQTLSQTMFNLNAAETDSSLQKLTKDISPRLANFKNSITLDPVLFSKVKSVYENTGRNSLTTEQITLLENTYKDFVRSGANLDSLKKEEYRAITEELAKLSVEFDENVLTETNEYILHITDSNDLSGLSDNILKAAKEEAMNRNLEGWVFTLHYSSYSSFMKYADNRALREKLFKAYNSRGNHKNDHNNCDIIHRITELRLRQANLLGYPDYAAYILDRRMAETPENVYTFLEDLIKAYHEAATQDVDNIRSYAKAAGINFELTYWDLNYYSEKLKKEHFDINDESTRPYFRLENVEKGIFRLARELYGITFQENKSVQVYHPDVKVYEVHDTDNGLVGLLYMDYFPREGKKQGAWMTEYVQQQKTGGQDIRPHISLVFNFSKPTEEKPSLLTYREVRTLLHEFGHAMHGLFSDVTYSSLSGTSVYRDFVELPSQIMENWAEEKEWLHWVAMHYETGEKMPDDMIDKIIESKNFMKAYGTYRQISFGLTDMAWHTITNAGEKDVESFEKEAMEPVNLLPWVEGTAISPSFSHIFAGGYAAGYYGYKWAEVLDADAFSLFKEKGIFDKKTAADFREHILSKGGTDHPMTLYVKFRGHKPSIEPLLTRSGIQTHGI